HAARCRRGRRQRHAGARRQMPALLARAERSRHGRGASRFVRALLRCGGRARRPAIAGAPRMMLRRGLAVAAVVAVADQLSKAWVLRLFTEQPVERMQPVTGFFNLVLTWNGGMSFGLFKTTPRSTPRSSQ